MKVLKTNFPIILLVFLSAIPIIRWAFLEPISIRFFDFNSTMTSLGQITGLLGMTLFAINLILSNRTHFFDKIFGGLHHFYNAHKWLGSLSFSLLLFHPLFLVIKYISISTYEAAMFLLPNGNNVSVTFGIVALLGMIVLLGITFYLKIKYHIWRFSHKFMVIVFVFAIFHTFLISSDISRDMFLRYYVLFFSFVGLLSGAYRAYFRFLFNTDYEFTVKKVQMLNNNVFEIELIPNKKVMDFSPGQFIFIRFVGVGVSSEPHPFSIASSVNDDVLKIVIKSLGDFTSKLANIQSGMLAKVEGPYGSFYKNKNSTKKEIWIAGGVGITPFLAMARSLNNIDFEIDLYFCLKNKNEAVLLNELEYINKVNNKLKIIPWYSEEKGFITAQEIGKLSGSTRSADIYLCGPPAFMKILRNQFINLGVENRNIYFEEFNFL